MSRRITDRIYWQNMTSQTEHPFIPCSACDREYRLRQTGVIEVGNRLYQTHDAGPATLLVEYRTDPRIHGRDCDGESIPIHDHHAPGLESRGTATSEEKRLVIL